jgi:chromosome partitioning protein
VKKGYKMHTLRQPFTIKHMDIRELFGVTGPTLSDLYKKLDIEFANSDATPKRGTAKYLFGTDVRTVLEAKGFEYPQKAKVYSLFMCKGGVGKTTTTFLLSQRFSAYGAKVLVIDADSQGNLTSAFGLDQYDYEIDEGTPVLMDVISEECNIEDAIIPLSPTLHILPSTPMNANLESRIRERFKNISRPFVDVIEPLKEKYDYIFFDCAPALNLTNTAAVCASDCAILPVAPDKFSQLGLEQSLKELDQIEKDFNLSIEKKILFTKFDARELTSLKYLSEIVERYENQNLDTAIRTCADVKNVVTLNEDLFSMRRSNAKEDYDGLAKELMGLSAKFKKKK